MIINDIDKSIKTNKEYKKWILVELLNENGKQEKIFFTKDFDYFVENLLSFFGDKAKSAINDYKILTLFQNEDYIGKWATLIEKGFVEYVLYNLLDDTNNTLGLRNDSILKKQIQKNINKIGKEKFKEMILDKNRNLIEIEIN